MLLFGCLRLHHVSGTCTNDFMLSAVRRRAAACGTSACCGPGRSTLVCILLQGAILTYVSLRLNWAKEARRAAALLAVHSGAYEM